METTPMTVEFLIVDALRNFGTDILGRSQNHWLLDACESFYMNGVADEQCGNVEYFGHYYRVNRWIVQTDSQGFKEVFSFETETEAKKRFEMVELYSSPTDDSALQFASAGIIRHGILYTIPL